MSQGQRRNSLLGWASVALGASAVVLAASDVLALIDSFRSHQPEGFQVAAGCKLLLDLALVGAFACGGAAFLSEAKLRPKRLELGATLAAGGATIGLIGGAVAAAVGIDRSFPSIYVLILALVVAARFGSVFAALGASKAFSGTLRAAADGLAQRDRRLAWASLGLAVSYVLAMISQLLLISYSSDHGASSEVIVGVSLNAAGAALVAGAGAMGSVAFFVSQQRQRAGRCDWLRERDARLGVAMAAFACAFCLIGVGFIVQAGAVGQNASTAAQFALAGTSSFGNAIAGVCAGVGFKSSRQQALDDATHAGDIKSVYR